MEILAWVGLILGVIGAIKWAALSKAKVCSAAAVCIVAAIEVLVVVYGFVYILTKGV